MSQYSRSLSPTFIIALMTEAARQEFPDFMQPNGGLFPVLAVGGD
jgi:hypothetical protein